MKTSMAYRLYRLYFNSNADNYQLFGNRVYNPLNGQNLSSDQFSAAFVRILILLVAIGALAAVASL